MSELSRPTGNSRMKERLIMAGLTAALFGVPSAAGAAIGAYEGNQLNTAQAEDASMLPEMGLTKAENGGFTGFVLGLNVGLVVCAAGAAVEEARIRRSEEESVVLGGY